eukprot:g18810.t1
MVYSGDFTGHMRTLQKVYNCMREKDLTFKVTKMKMDYPEVIFLGHMLDGKGRQYIENYSEKVAPLHALTKKGVIVPKAWDKSHETAVDELKEALVSQPCLQMVDNTKPFEVRVDACRRGRGCGAILLQPGEDGGMHPVCYWSKTLNKYEREYAATEVEAMALHDAILYWDVYLKGVYGFKVYTDHNALTYMYCAQTASNNGRIMRWLMDLQGYNFELYYKEGKVHYDADAVSRLLRKGEEPEFLTADDLEWDKGIPDEMMKQVARDMEAKARRRIARIAQTKRDKEEKKLKKDGEEVETKSMAIMGCEPEGDLTSAQRRRVRRKIERVLRKKDHTVHLDPMTGMLERDDIEVQRCRLRRRAIRVAHKRKVKLHPDVYGVSDRVLRTRLPKVNPNRNVPRRDDWMEWGVPEDLGPLVKQNVCGTSRVIVGESTIEGANRGLFAKKELREGSIVCDYFGKKVAKEEVEREDYNGEYVFEARMKGGVKYVDAIDLCSCWGRFINDPLDDTLVNAKVIVKGKRLIVVATTEILPGDEIFISYGPAYWMDRLDKLPAKVRAEVEQEYDRLVRAEQKRQGVKVNKQSLTKSKQLPSNPVAVSEHVGESDQLSAKRVRSAVEQMEDLELEKYAFDNVIQSEELAEQLQKRNPLREFKSETDKAKYKIARKLQARFEGPYVVTERLSPGVEKAFSGVNMQTGQREETDMDWFKMKADHPELFNQFFKGTFPGSDGAILVQGKFGPTEVRKTSEKCQQCTQWLPPGTEKFRRVCSRCYAISKSQEKAGGSAVKEHRREEASVQSAAASTGENKGEGGRQSSVKRAGKLEDVAMHPVGQHATAESEGGPFSKVLWEDERLARELQAEEDRSRGREVHFPEEVTEKGWTTALGNSRSAKKQERFSGYPEDFMALTDHSREELEEWGVRHLLEPIPRGEVQGYWERVQAQGNTQLEELRELYATDDIEMLMGALYLSLEEVAQHEHTSDLYREFCEEWLGYFDADHHEKLSKLMLSGQLREVTAYFWRESEGSDSSDEEPGWGKIPPKRKEMSEFKTFHELGLYVENSPGMKEELQRELEVRATEWREEYLATFSQVKREVARNIKPRLFTSVQKSVTTAKLETVAREFDDEELSVLDVVRLYQDLDDFMIMHHWSPWEMCMHLWRGEAYKGRLKKLMTAHIVGKVKHLSLTSDKQHLSFHHLVETALAYYQWKVALIQKVPQVDGDTQVWARLDRMSMPVWGRLSDWKGAYLEYRNEYAKLSEAVKSGPDLHRRLRSMCAASASSMSWIQAMESWKGQNGRSEVAWTVELIDDAVDSVHQSAAEGMLPTMEKWNTEKPQAKKPERSVPPTRTINITQKGSVDGAKGNAEVEQCYCGLRHSGYRNSKGCGYRMGKHKVTGEYSGNAEFAGYDPVAIAKITTTKALEAVKKRMEAAGEGDFGRLPDDSKKKFWREFSTAKGLGESESEAVLMTLNLCEMTVDMGVGEGAEASEDESVDSTPVVDSDDEVVDTDEDVEESDEDLMESLPRVMYMTTTFQTTETDDHTDKVTMLPVRLFQEGHPLLGVEKDGAKGKWVAVFVDGGSDLMGVNAEYCERANLVK